MSDLVQNKNEVGRRAAREQAFSLVFTKMFRMDCSVDEIIADSFDADDVKTDSFAREEAMGVYEHIEEIDCLITNYLTGWTLNRIPRSTLAVLRLAMYELEYNSSIPNAVVINEAVELAKKFCGDDDPAFVNGVLGSHIRATKSEQAE